MSLKRIFCALMCALLVVSGLALAEEDKDARIAELEAQVAELQAQVDAYHLKEIVASFDGGEVSLEDAESLYETYVTMYAQYGFDIAAYGMEDMVREQVVTQLAEEAIVQYMAGQLGLGLTEEQQAAFAEEATASYEDTVDLYYQNYFASQYENEDEGLSAAATYLNESGYTYETVLENLERTQLSTNVYNYVTGDVTVSEEEIQQAYDELVAADEANYSQSAYQFETAYSNGTTIYYTPEGYRNVKHILFRFDDEQAAAYDELATRLEELEAEENAAIEAAAAAEATEAPTEAPEATAETGAETAAAENAEPEVAETEAPAEAEAETEAAEPEATEAPATSEDAATALAETEHRPLEEIAADIAEVEAQIEEIYLQILPEAEAAIERFNNGEDIETLIAELNDDTGMPDVGYAISETAEISSQPWDPAFTEGALSIAEIGGLSEPVRGVYGIHLIYYAGDLTSGATPLEEVHDVVESTALQNKITQTYADQLAAWKEELNLQMYPENLA